MTTDAPESMTIGRLARAAGVGIETIRYYQQRALLPVPITAGAFRHYPAALASRIRFIKRAQELGFSLDEITELLRLEDGTDRNSIRRIASDRLGQIERKLADLMRMQKTLRHLVAQCEHTRADLPCPIIATLAQPSTSTAKPAAGAGPIAAPLAVPETLIPGGDAHHRLSIELMCNSSPQVHAGLADPHRPPSLEPLANLMRDATDFGVAGHP